MLADRQGNPLAFTLTPGQEADISEAPTLIARAQQAAAVVADKGYDADALIELLHEQGCCLSCYLVIHRQVCDGMLHREEL